MSLRARLLLGLVALAISGLGAMALTTYEAQRAFLMTRVDQQVSASRLVVASQLGVLRGLPGPPREIGLPAARIPRLKRRPGTFQAFGTYGELIGAGGRLLKEDDFSYGQSVDSPPLLPKRLPLTPLASTRAPRYFTVDSKDSDTRYRVAAFSVGDGQSLVIAVPLREVDQTLNSLLVVEGLVGGGIILALLLLGWVVIRVGLQPLEQIGEVARKIAGGDLTRRVAPATQRTEVGRLGLSLNEMLVRIERAFADRTESEDRLRQFLADASHELRTPLASIRGYAEAFRLGAADEPETLGRAMGRIEAETVRMGALVEDLLLLARMDELPEIERVPVDLCELAEHMADDTRAIAPERTIGLSVTGQPVLVFADPDQLRQVLANLMRNALIHTPVDSPIELAVRRLGSRAVLEVRDHGHGLPEDAGDRVFERFWRSEGGRRRGRGGAGLGLAIVKAIVEAHHGEVHARNASDGGAEFRVVLPIMRGERDGKNGPQQALSPAAAAAQSDAQ